jgi:hypothetical protein
MSIDERRRLQLAEAVKRTLGEEAGVTLMEMLPPAGWADVATKHDLAALEIALEHKLMSSFRQELVAQTWRYVGAMGVLFAGFTAVIKL